MATNEHDRESATGSPIARTARGLTLPCPRCGDPAAAIGLLLAAGDRWYCSECEREFSTRDVKEFLSKWTAVIAWADGLPSGA
jgi:transposase-like protein